MISIPQASQTQPRRRISEKQVCASSPSKNENTSEAVFSRRYGKSRLKSGVQDALPHPVRLAYRTSIALEFVTSFLASYPRPRPGQSELRQPFRAVPDLKSSGPLGR